MKSPKYLLFLCLIGFALIISAVSCSKKHSSSNTSSGSGTPPVGNVAVSTFSLTIMKLGDGTGTVTSDPTGINCGTVCSETYADQTSLTLHAVPSNGQTTFSGWTGDCSGTGDCVVKMSGNKTVKAGFVQQQRILTVTTTGLGSGSVTSAPSGISCGNGGSNCSGGYVVNSTVTLSATPTDAASEFLGWSGACNGVGVCSVLMDQAQNVSANYGQVKKTLTVTMSGAGSGAVASSPLGITCGSDCTEDYLYGTAIQLNPTPKDSFSTFDQWTGGCSGNGTCMVAMNQTQSVDASFKKVSLDGDYVGTNSQGYPFILSVKNEGIAVSSTSLVIHGTYCSATIQTQTSYPQPGLTIDSNHSFSDNSGSSSLSGTFTSPSTGNGSFYKSNSYCNGSVTLSWTVSRVIGSAGISASAARSFNAETKDTIISIEKN